MPKFRVEMTATKVVEIELDDDAIEHGETLEEGVESMANECAFRNAYPDMVRIVEDWNLTVEEVRQLAD